MKTFINDFSIQFSTVNGSGSATANNTILKSIFHMGIPVSGRNNFPSNIQGMPTWYTLRVSGDGFLGRKEKVDILVAMNATSIEHDIQQLSTGSVILFDKRINLPQISEGISLYEMPVEEIIKNAED